MQIRRKFFFANLSVFLFVIIVGVVGVFFTYKTEQEFLHLANKLTPSIAALERIRFAGLRIVSSTTEYGFILAEKSHLEGVSGETNDSPSETEEELLASGEKELLIAIKAYKQAAGSDIYHENFYIRLDTLSLRLIEMSDQLINLKQQGVQGRLVLIKKEAFEQVESEFLVLLDQAIDHERGELLTKETQVKNYLVKALYVISAVALLAVGVVFLSSSILARNLLKPLDHFQDAVKRVGSGELDYQLPNKNRSDELGNIARAFNKMVMELKQLTSSLVESKDTAERANKVKSEFLANMSHELRTPMHAILSYSELGTKKQAFDTSQSTYRYFKRINESGERLLTLLNDLLDLSKFESGSVSLERKLTDLTTVVMSCIKELEPEIVNKGVSLHISDTEIDTHAYIDSLRIRQVIMNVISNAIKFTPAGKNISLSFERDHLVFFGEEEYELPAVRFCVKDEGVGIPLSEQDDIFNEFVQSTKTKSGAGGTGLGLAISKNIVEAYGGRIWAESMANCVGATFYIVLPQQQYTDRSCVPIASSM